MRNEYIILEKLSNDFLNLLKKLSEKYESIESINLFYKNEYSILLDKINFRKSSDQEINEYFNKIRSSINRLVLLLKKNKIEEINEIILIRNEFSKIIKSENKIINHSSNALNKDFKTIRGRNNLSEQYNFELHTMKVEIERLRKDLKNISSQASTATSDAEKIHTAFRGALDSLGNLQKETIVYIKDKKKEIETLLSLSSKNVLTGKYSENAHRELISAKWLRFIAIVLMLIISAFTAKSLFDLQSSTITIQQFSTRIIASLILSIPAIYLSRESEKYRKNHTEYLKKISRSRSI